MKMIQFFLKAGRRPTAGPAALLTALLVTAAPAFAVDLKKIDRTIAKEPAYATKQPKYCLLVFGPQAATRVWLVIDGDFLYIDRNGNGDLTEPGERLRFSKFNDSDRGPYSGEREVEAGDISEGKLKHERLVVTQQRVSKKFAAMERWEEELQTIASKADEYMVYSLRITLEIRPRPGDPIRIAGRVDQYAGIDGAGFLQFADRPQDAPIVHFRGPLQMGLYSPQRLVLGPEPEDLKALVGMVGLGKGTFASIPFGGLIAEEAKPVAEVEFSPAVPGSASPLARYTLPHRC
jgi:hypothetical protein